MTAFKLTRFSLTIGIQLFLLLNCTLSTDYYAILEVSRSATPEMIKKAYKTKLIKMHPDRFPESKKKEMEEKFKKVQEAFEVLGDPYLKPAYDRMGMAGLDQAKKDKQQRDQWETQNKMHQEHFQNQQKNQDPLMNSQIELLNLENISKFHRRIGAWVLWFYKYDDADINVMAPLMEKFKKDYDGIIQVARVNCVEEEELCREFMIYATSKVFVYSSFAGFDGKELDYSEEMIQARKGNGLKLLGYVANEAINVMEDFVVFLSENTIKDFEERKGPKMILFTAKTSTPPLWKVMSKEFKNSASFGIVKGQDNPLAKKFKVSNFPAILGFRQSWLSNPTLFTDGEFKKEPIKKFIRNILLTNEDQREELQIIEQADLWENRHCGSNDKKYCLFFLTDDVQNPTLVDTLDVLKKELAKEPFKIALVPANYFNDVFFSDNQLTPQNANIVITKGFTNRAIAFKTEGFELPGVRAVINDVLSSIVTLKKLVDLPEKYVAINSEL